MEYKYNPNGVCSKEFIFDIDETKNIVRDLQVVGGCNGNLKGIASLIKNMEVEEVIKKLSGIQCGFRNTSCPDQIAQVLNAYLARK